VKRPNLGEASARASWHEEEPWSPLEPPPPAHEEVLNAAVVAALDAGIVATTVKHVTSRAGISNTRFYEVFGRAENLIPRLVDHCWSLIARRVALETFHEVPDGPADGVLAMYRAVARMIDDEVSRAAVEVVLAVERRDLDEDLTSWSQGRGRAQRIFEEKVGAWCQRLVEASGCAYDNADLLQRDLWLAFASTFTAWLWASQRLNGESVADACATRLSELQRKIIQTGVPAVEV
jgi:AcrR family transcriptional regulator